MSTWIRLYLRTLTSYIPQTQLEHILKIKGEGSERLYVTQLLLKFYIVSSNSDILFFSTYKDHAQSDGSHVLILLMTRKQNSRRLMLDSNFYAGYWADIISSDFNHEIRRPFRLTASKAGLEVVSWREQTGAFRIMQGYSQNLRESQHLSLHKSAIIKWGCEC